MDQQLMAQLGVAAALVPSVAAIVNPTVSHFRGAFLLTGKACMSLSYALSMFLMFILVMATDASFFDVPMYATICKTFVCGWLAGTFAGQIADAHSRAKEKQARSREDQEPLVYADDDGVVA